MNDGDPGFGLVDEISGDVTFDGVAGASFCWTAQAGALEYGVARSDVGAFDGACVRERTSNTCWVDPDAIPVGTIRFLLVRSTLPNLGSWGVTFPRLGPREYRRPDLQKVLNVRGRVSLPEGRSGG